MNWLQGKWKKLVGVSVFLFMGVLVIRDRHQNADTLEQFQRRLLACTHHSDSLASQLEGLLIHSKHSNAVLVINHYKEAVDRMLGQEKNTSARAAQGIQKQNT
jgi:hypothetical protein